MGNNEKVEASMTGFDSNLKTENFTGSENAAFPGKDNTTEFQSLGSVIEGITQAGKTIRLYRCFACKRHFAVFRMATALIFCRDCFKRTQAKGRLARLNAIDRITNDLRIFLRERLEVR